MKKGLTFSVAAVLAIVLLAPGAARANSPEASDTHAVHYYVSLGDSLAASFQPNDDLTHGCAEQVYAKLKASDATLRVLKLQRQNRLAVAVLRVDRRRARRNRTRSFHSAAK